MFEIFNLPDEEQDVEEVTEQSEISEETFKEAQK